MSRFLRNINVINVLLAAAIITSADFYVMPVANKEAKFTVPPAKEAAPENPVKPMAEPAAPPIDYNLIAEQNLFNPERKIPVEKPQEKALPKPDLVLYGTLIADGLSVAYVDDKQAQISTPGRGKRLRVLRKGDSISGFVLRDIEPDKIVLVRGDETMTVNLSEPKPRSGEKPVTPGRPMLRRPGP